MLVFFGHTSRSVSFERASLLTGLLTSLTHMFPLHLYERKKHGLKISCFCSAFLSTSVIWNDLSQMWIRPLCSKCAKKITWKTDNNDRDEWMDKELKYNTKFVTQNNKKSLANVNKMSITWDFNCNSFKMFLFFLFFNVKQWNNNMPNVVTKNEFSLSGFYLWFKWVDGEFFKKSLKVFYTLSLNFTAIIYVQT